MKKLVKVMIVMLFVNILISVGAVLAQESFIEEGETIIIGFDDTFAPFGFKDEEGNIVGFDIDLAEEVLSRMNVSYEFQPIDWTTKETELNTGNIDAIWNGYSVTDEREKVVDFSLPYIENRQIILVKADSEIQNKGDLAGKTIATQADSASLEGILKDKEFVASLDGEAPITYSTFVEVFADLDNGRVDAIVVDETLATYYLTINKQADDYRILEDNFGEENYAVGFRKSDTAFLELFNATLQEVMDDGTFDEIKEKWFVNLEDETE